MHHLEEYAADTRPALPVRTTPAWAFSTLLHVVGLVALALALHQPARPVPDEASRPVGIVLAANNAQDVVYFEPTTTSETQNSAASAASSPAESSNPLPPASATDQSAVMSSPDLPGELELASAARGALHDVVSSGGGRPSILPGLGDAEIFANDLLLNAPPAPKLGPTATMKIFGTTSVGRSFIFLIDRSKSMGGEGLGAIDAAQVELKRAFSALTPAQSFQIVAYNQRLSASDANLLPATDENKTLADKFVGGIIAHGQTEHSMAILAALRNKPEVVYVFTDGGEPPLTQPELHTITLRASDSKTTIHCVQFGFGPLQDDDPFLRKLAGLNGGKFAYIDMRQSRSGGNFP